MGDPTVPSFAPRYTGAVRWSLALLPAALLAACPRPPVGPPPPPPPDGDRTGPLAAELCIQDRPAISGKWYDYDPDGHTLTPKPQAWILRDASVEPARFAALRIVSAYEPDAAESGRFTFGMATWDGAAWSAESEWLTPRNMKDQDLCLDVFAQTEEPCDGDGWHLRLAEFQYLSPLSGFAAQNLGLFARSWAGRPELGAVHLARLDDVTALTALPDPTSLTELADGPATSWESSDWAFGELAPNLPEAAMALGQRFVDAGFVGRDDVYFMLTVRYDLVRFTVRPVADGDPSAGLRFAHAAIPVEFEDYSMPVDIPEPVTVDVASPAAGSVSWLSFQGGSLLSPAEDVAEAAFPYTYPRSSRFDLAVEAMPDSSLRLLLSPGSCIINATQLGFDTSVPPVSPE